MPDVPVFDPNKPYEVVKPKPPEFDPNKPYEVSGGKPQSTGAAGLLSRMRDALAAGGRGVMQGAGDILYGGAQIGARMGEAPQIGQTQPEMPGGAARVDQAVQQREKTYQGSVAGHPVASAAGRLLGNMAATLPLGMAGGAVARGAGLAGRLATAGAVGAGAGAMQPTEGKNFGKEKLQQAVYGTAGGVAGGAVGEAGGSLLSKAIAGNAPAAVDAALTNQFRRAVRPGKPTPNTASGRTTQDARILGAVDSIIQAKPDLQLTNEAGQKVTGQLPRSLAQLEEAVGQAKGKVYKEYDDMARAAGEKGALVDLEPIAKELRKMADDPAITVHHPEVEQFANAYADRLESVGRYSAKTAQDSLEVLNQTLRAWWKNPTTATVGSNAVYAKVSEMLRDGLDTAVTKLEGSGYQVLRNKFGALKSVEDAISRAVTRDQNKTPGGLTGSLSNLVASAEFWRGAATLSPGRIKDAAIIKASQMMMRRLESPNRAIERLFAKREATAGRPPLSPLRSAIGGAMSSPVPGMGGALAGGSLSAPPSARTYFEDPRYNQVQLPSGITVSR